MSERITLGAGPLQLTLDPGVGGSIAAFDWVEGGARVPILRGSGDVSDDVLAMGSFPLVPFVNRIRDGKFTFRGRTVTLARNMASDASPLHGQGWLNAWQVDSADAASATLSYDHLPGEWPWAYRAEQHFALDGNGLTLALSCRNRSDEPMPCGLGQHPYFHCTATTRIATRVGEVWTIDDKVLPVDRIPATGEYDLSDRAVCGLGLDHGFGGWGGAAILTDEAWPFRVTMSSSEAKFFQLYSPQRGEIFVVEPVTHANAALNQPEVEWDDLGLRVLAPRDAMTMTMRLEVG